VQPPDPPFTPSADVSVLLNTLLDILERRLAGRQANPADGFMARTVKTPLKDLVLPGYDSQIDPEPRQVANEQLQWLEQAGALRLFWQPGEKGHLLEAVALVYGAEERLYPLLKRTPPSSLRVRLESQLLGDRFRFYEHDWQYRAIQHVLAQINENKSPAPFSLTDPAFNEDLLSALAALAQLQEETPFRVFSVHVFNDSKRFEDLKKPIVRLARFGRPDWKRLSEDEVLRELNLVANPSYLLLSGPWLLADRAGQVISLGEFIPSVGLPAVQAAQIERVSVHADMVVCIENLTTFHTMAGSLAKNPHAQSMVLLCLAGNPSPACRRLLLRLVECMKDSVPLYAWADLDYGGFNILSQLRREVSPHFMPYKMDIETLTRFVRFARPLTPADQRNLDRQMNRHELEDVRPVMEYMRKHGLKLEQEAITG
jgi:hypothetical protein